VEDLKSILVCDLFYRVAFDIVGPLPTREISIFLLPFTIILNGVKQKFYSITLQQQPLDFWKNISFVDMKCLSFFYQQWW
jgi:hypothetical protein